MKFLQIHTFYQAYLDEFYRRQPALAGCGFRDQIQALIADGFAGGHMFAPYLESRGYRAHLVIANCGPAQRQWARENGVRETGGGQWFGEIVRRQVETIKPDILYLSDPITFDSRFLRSLDWRPALVAGWRAASIPAETDWSGFDLMLSSVTTCRQRALQLGARHTEHFFPGFPAGIAEQCAGVTPEWDVVFSGQWTEEHAHRNGYVLEVARQAPGRDYALGLYIATPDPGSLPGFIQAKNLGPRWGLEMFRTLRRGRIVLNAGISGFNFEAPNMRLFEATGVGAFLLTESQKFLENYFESGTEIETFSNTDELLEKISYYLAHPHEREARARRAQERCRREHSMEARAQEFDDVLKRYLGQKHTRPGAAAAPDPDIAVLAEGAVELLNAYENEPALWALDQCLRLQPQATGLLYGKAVALARLERVPAARDALATLLASQPDHDKGRRLLAALGDEEPPGRGAAGDAGDRGGAEAADTVPGLRARGEEALQAGDWQRALGLFSQAKAGRQPQRGLDYCRALCFRHLNQPAAAREALREELRYFGDHQQARELLEQLAEPSPVAETTGPEPEFRKLLQVIRPYTMLSEERLYSLFTLARRACTENVGGNFVECGVAAGGSTALLAYVAQRFSRQPRLVFAFDSFEGMPAPTARDTHAGVAANDTGWGTGTCAAPEASVRGLCERLGVGDRVRIVKGYFEETVPRDRDRVGMIALLHLDGDWYDSTRVVLENLYDRVVSGGFLQIDDYGYWEGCRQAVGEFAEARQLSWHLKDIDGTGVWVEKTEGWPINPEIPAELAAEFAGDDPASRGLESQMSRNERFQLYYASRHLLPGRAPTVRFVEIGSYAGASLALMDAALQRRNIPYQGYAIEPAGRPQFFEVIRRLHPRVEHVPQFSREAAQQLGRTFAADANYPELIFVDGDHTYQGVRQDILDYYPLLAPGGIMIFHDYLPAVDEANREAIHGHHGGKEPGVRRACQLFMERHCGAQAVALPLLHPSDPTQTQAHLPIIPGVFSTLRAYVKPREAEA